MNDTIQTFIETKEKRLEALTRGGLLKHEDAREKLCAFTDTVRQTIRWLQKLDDDNNLFNDVTVSNMLLLVALMYAVLC